MEQMKQRLDFYKASPEAIKAMMALEVAVSKLGIDPALQELLRLRASQINGCAYCVDLHTGDARKKPAKPSGACTPCRSGTKPRSSRRASAPPWPGRKP
jgi:AhpD family alkylhydroperoxidase